MSAENPKTIAERVKVIDDLLKKIVDERPRTNMKGKRNTSNRLVAYICIRGHNEEIIEEACKIIETLKEENKDLSKTIDDIQSQPSP